MFLEFYQIIVFCNTSLWLLSHSILLKVSDVHKAWQQPLKKKEEYHFIVKMQTERLLHF